MRGVWLAGATSLAAATGAAFDHTHAAYTRILAAHVRDGLVRYGTLKAHPGPLDDYLGTLSAVPRERFDGWTWDERTALLLNAYNAWTLKLVTGHYPVQSIKDIGGFLKGPWKQPIVRLWGGTLTLDDLEHGILRTEYRDPRIHFGLVCAARSCPKLREEAYRGDRLNAQLDADGRRFLADAARNRFHPAARRAELSPIFKWFAADFGASQPERLRWLSAFAPPEARESLRRDRWTVSYLPYDWSLNDRP